MLYKGMYADGVFYFNGESLASLHLSIRENVRQQLRVENVLQIMLILTSKISFLVAVASVVNAVKWRWCF